MSQAQPKVALEPLGRLKLTREVEVDEARRGKQTPIISTLLTRVRTDLPDDVGLVFENGNATLITRKAFLQLCKNNTINIYIGKRTYSVTAVELVEHFQR